MRVVVGLASDVGAQAKGAGALRVVDEEGEPIGAVQQVAEVAGAVAELERTEGPRWVWADAGTYRRLAEAGVRVRRSHDLALTEALLLGYDGRWGQPRSLAAAWARMTGGPVPDDPPVLAPDENPTLFEPERGGLAPGVDPLDAAVAVHAEQRRRIEKADHPGRLSLLAAIDSAGALAAVEMGRAGLPFSDTVHNEMLTEMLGTRTPVGVRPLKLARLAAEVADAFGDRRVNPDSPAEVLRAFNRAGYSLPSTRAWVLKEIDHPAVKPLLAYKELARIHSAHGWSWQNEWIRGGRFRPEYVPAAVVSGRWATRGGGALQIPRLLRRAVVADPGHVLVVADAGQLEPRVLAALSRDPALMRAATDTDMYAALAAEAFGGDRPRAKIGLLAAMYGQTAGEAAAPLATLKQRYPQALRLLEDAARTGEMGRTVRSHLGRTSPPFGAIFMADQPVTDTPAGEREATSRARSRGRFTRNFVVQATASEWAGALLADLRRRLASIDGAELVFYQHDEVIVHAPASAAAEVSAEIVGAAQAAKRLLFGDTVVRFPVSVEAVQSYADADHSVGADPADDPSGDDLPAL